MTEVLAIRNTHKYVGTYQHLDQWEDIGTFEVLSTKARSPSDEDLDDPCDPETYDQWLKIESDSPPEKIEEALRNSLTQHDCACEYDCCGCRSYHVGKVENEGGRIWRVSVSSSRNF